MANEAGTATPDTGGVRESIEDAERMGSMNPEDSEPERAWMSRALHDLSQPLTALECLLYVNRDPVVGESLDAGLLRSVMDAGLVECGRMMVLVRGMQDRLRGL